MTRKPSRRDALRMIAGVGVGGSILGSTTVGTASAYSPPLMVGQSMEDQADGYNGFGRDSLYGAGTVRLGNTVQVKCHNVDKDYAGQEGWNRYSLEVDVVGTGEFYDQHSDTVDPVITSIDYDWELVDGKSSEIQFDVQDLDKPFSFAGVAKTVDEISHLDVDPYADPDVDTLTEVTDADEAVTEYAIDIASWGANAIDALAAAGLISLSGSTVTAMSVAIGVLNVLDTLSGGGDGVVWDADWGPIESRHGVGLCRSQLSVVQKQTVDPPEIRLKARTHTDAQTTGELGEVPIDPATSSVQFELLPY